MNKKLIFTIVIILSFVIDNNYAHDDWKLLNDFQLMLEKIQHNKNKLQTTYYSIEFNDQFKVTIPLEPLQKIYLENLNQELVACKKEEACETFYQSIIKNIKSKKLFLESLRSLNLKLKTFSLELLLLSTEGLRRFGLSYVIYTLIFEIIEHSTWQLPLCKLFQTFLITSLSGVNANVSVLVKSEVKLKNKVKFLENFYLHYLQLKMKMYHDFKYYWELPIHSESTMALLTHPKSSAQLKFDLFKKRAASILIENYLTTLNPLHHSQKFSVKIEQKSFQELTQVERLFWFQQYKKSLYFQWNELKSRMEIELFEHYSLIEKLKFSWLVGAIDKRLDAHLEKAFWHLLKEDHVDVYSSKPFYESLKIWQDISTDWKSILQSPIEMELLKSKQKFLWVMFSELYQLPKWISAKCLKAKWISLKYQIIKRK